MGTSGWTYGAWKDSFYAGVPRHEWLAHYAHRFRAVEVNATFYHQLKQNTFVNWTKTTPPDFRFAIKGHRYLTHVLKLHVSRGVFSRQKNQAEVGGWIFCRIMEPVERPVVSG